MLTIHNKHLLLVDPGGRDDELVLVVALALLPQDRVLGALLADEGGPESRDMIPRVI